MHSANRVKIDHNKMEQVHMWSILDIHPNCQVKITAGHTYVQYFTYSYFMGNRSVEIISINFLNIITASIKLHFSLNDSYNPLHSMITMISKAYNNILYSGYY